MGLFNLDMKNLNNSIIFNGLYSALLIAIMFFVNDLVDESILPRLSKQKKSTRKIKLLIHMAITFTVSVILVYIMWHIFGWGKAFTE